MKINRKNTQSHKFYLLIFLIFLTKNSYSMYEDEPPASPVADGSLAMISCKTEGNTKIIKEGLMIWAFQDGTYGVDHKFCEGIKDKLKEENLDKLEVKIIQKDGEEKQQIIISINQSRLRISTQTGQQTRGKFIVFQEKIEVQ